MNRRVASVLAALGAMLFLASCHLDTTVTVVMDDDGTGVVRVIAVADPELASEVPNLAEALRLGDVREAGWRVDGPTETNSGGLRIALAHDFRDAQEATALLSSLGGPFSDVTVTRSIEGEGDDATARNELAGQTVLRQGFDGFADQALLDAVGGTPFGERLAGFEPADTATITLRVDLPGSIEQADSSASVDDGIVTWGIPVDGSQQSVVLHTLQSPSEAPSWAGPLAIGALVALGVWALLSIGLVTVLIRVRRRGSR